MDFTTDTQPVGTSPNTTVTPTAAQSITPTAAQSVTPTPSVTVTAPAPAAPATQTAQTAQKPAQPQPAQQAQAAQPVQAQAPQVTMEFYEEPAEEAEEEETPPRLILNTQQILNDWKFEKGKVLIFFMHLINGFSILAAIVLYVLGFVFLAAVHTAIGFLDQIRAIPNVETFAYVFLLAATGCAIWSPFTKRLSPFFKGFSIAKWLKKNNIDPYEVMKIFLQSRLENELTKYESAHGGISAEQADLAQGCFLLLDEKHKSSFRGEMICSIIFWVLFSAIKALFIIGLGKGIADICLQIQAMTQEGANFDFMSLPPLLFNTYFVIGTLAWIVVGILFSIIRAAVRYTRNKEQQKWVEGFMPSELPTEEYY